MKPDKITALKQARMELQYEGLYWIEYNNGYHFKIGKIDFWPTTGKWHDSDNEVSGDNIDSLLEFLKYTNIGEKPAYKVLSVEQIFTIAKKVKPMNLEKICETLHKEIYG